MRVGKEAAEGLNKPWLLPLGAWPHMKFGVWDISSQPLVLEGGFAFHRTYGKGWGHSFFSFFFVFLVPHLQHMEVPRVGV